MACSLCSIFNRSIDFGVFQMNGNAIKSFLFLNKAITLICTITDLFL